MQRSEQRAEYQREDQVDGGDDGVDLEAAEGARVDVGAGMEELVGADLRRYACCKHQQNELTGERRVYGFRGLIEDDVPEHLQVRQPEREPCLHLAFVNG